MTREPLDTPYTIRLSASQKAYLDKVAAKKEWDVAELLRHIIDELRTGSSVLTKRKKPPA